jgi:multiple antibiotic resistance protein
MQPGNLEYAVRAFVTLLAIVDPLGNVPFYLTATQRMTPSQRYAVAMRSCLVACLVLMTFAVGGAGILMAFRVTMPAVLIGGGIILLVIALQMLSGRQFDWERDRPPVDPNQTPEHASVVPLAIPLMAGPGAMSSVIALTAQQPALPSLAIVLAVILVVCFIQYLCYSSSGALMRVLGRTFMVTLSCLMGLILSALAIQFMLDGLSQAMPGLFKR